MVNGSEKNTKGITLIAFLLSVVLLLGIAGVWFFLMKRNHTTQSTPVSKATYTEKPVTLISGSPFQLLLRRQCKFTHTHEENPALKYYGIDLSELPLNFSDNVKERFAINQNLICQAAASDFEENKHLNISFLYAPTLYPIGGKGSLIIGDASSKILGFRPPDLSFDAEFKKMEQGVVKEPVVYTAGEAKTLLEFEFRSDPFFPTENIPLNVSFLTYKELGDYRLLIMKDYSIPMIGNIKTKFIKYAEKIDKSGPDSGLYGQAEYKMDSGYKDFIKDVIATDFTSYEDLQPVLRGIIDDSVSEINGISLKP